MHRTHSYDGGEIKNSCVHVFNHVTDCNRFDSRVGGLRKQSLCSLEFSPRNRMSTLERNDAQGLERRVFVNTQCSILAVNDALNLYT